MADAAKGFTHLDAAGAARMVDVGDKDVTRRVAVARGGVSGKVVVYPQAPDLPFAPVGDRWTAADERGLLGEADGDEDAGAANGRD